MEKVSHFLSGAKTFQLCRVQSEAKSLVSYGARSHGPVDGSGRPPSFAQPQHPIINESGQLDARVLALHRLDPDDHHGVEAQRAQGTPL